MILGVLWLPIRHSQKVTTKLIYGQKYLSCAIIYQLAIVFRITSKNSILLIAYDEKYENLKICSIPGKAS